MKNKIERLCFFCKSKFIATNPKNIYCSYKCKKANHRLIDQYKETAEKYKKSNSRKDSLKRYNRSEKNKLVQKKYRGSSGHTEAQKRYYKSETRKKSFKKYRSSQQWFYIARANNWKRKSLIYKNSDNTVNEVFLRISKEHFEKFWIKENIDFKTLHLEHLKSIASGGMHSIYNCYYCPEKINLKKRSKDPEVFFNSIKKGLYKKIEIEIKKVLKKFFKSQKNIQVIDTFIPDKNS